MNVIICRICLTILKDTCLDITSTYIEDKTLIRLMESAGQITIRCTDDLPRYVCMACSEKLFKFNELRKQIHNTETNLFDKVLTIVQAGDKSMVVFVEKKLTNINAIIDETIRDVRMDIEEASNRPDLLKTGDIIDFPNNTDGVVAVDVKVEECDLLNDLAIKYECDLIGKSKSEGGSVSPAKKMQFSCDQCGSSHRSKSNLIMHKKKKHPEQSFLSKDLPNHENIDDKEKPYACQLCGRRFRYPQHLKFHETSHASKKVTCNVCGKILQKSYLLRHKQLLHKGSKTACNICEQEFNTISNLDEHKRLRHSGAGKYPCDICGTMLSSYTSYFRHKRSKHMGGRHKCAICEATYCDRSKCKLHVKKHHPERAEDTSVIVSFTVGMECLSNLASTQ